MRGEGAPGPGAHEPVVGARSTRYRQLTRPVVQVLHAQGDEEAGERLEQQEDRTPDHAHRTGPVVECLVLGLLGAGVHEGGPRGDGEGRPGEVAEGAMYAQRQPHRADEAVEGGTDVAHATREVLAPR